MNKIPFTVSARTARLIGRENVANAEGAIIELVKNAYDADATACIIFFDNTYNSIPKRLSPYEFANFSKAEKSGSIANSYQKTTDGNYLLAVDSEKSSSLLDSLMRFFKRMNNLYILDNGCGMDDKVIVNKWMTIGTDNKELEYKTTKGRIKAGAKGIGRFALDRLGEQCEVYTAPQEHNHGFLWKVDWRAFEKRGAAISDVKADLERIPTISLSNLAIEFSHQRASVLKLLNETSFRYGTLIKISSLRDNWDDYSLDRLFSNLEVLVPPKEDSSFDIHLYASSQLDKYGKVNSLAVEDYDYKVSADYLADEAQRVLISIHRNELNIKRIENEYREVFLQETIKDNPRYSFEAFQKKEFVLKKSLADLVPGYQSIDTQSNLGRIGRFNFTFYFLKNQVSRKEEDMYPYNSFSSAERKKWLQNYSGVKIFRDGFRVRPYGESGNDWLGLGERQAQSPGGAGQKLGGYKVRPNQIVGVINISRTTNNAFQDKSGREGIQENEVFDLFKQILIGIINVFEKDRNTIMYSFRQLFIQRNEEAQAIAKAEEIANEASRKDRSKSKNGTTSDSKEQSTILAQGFNAQKRKIKEMSLELRMLRSLASTGLIVSSFAHELKNLSALLVSRIEDLETMIRGSLGSDAYDDIPEEDNPYILLKHMKEQDVNLKHWLDYSLSALRRDKRNRVNVDLNEYFANFKGVWHNSLKRRKTKLIINFCEQSLPKIRAFPIDLDTIFNNLLVNSIDAFKRGNTDRKIVITLMNKEEYVKIIFQDSGPGLSSDFKNPNDIFLPFETSKRDIRGNIVGTGMGMYLVKSLVDDYQGKVEIANSVVGFKLYIYLPLVTEGATEKKEYA